MSDFSTGRPEQPAGSLEAPGPLYRPAVGLQIQRARVAVFLDLWNAGHRSEAVKRLRDGLSPLATAIYLGAMLGESGHSGMQSFAELIQLASAADV